ncbi:MAG: phosphoribosylformylglycinamidine synthase subunit PurS [Chloroflexi bacterium]|nr:phosphoribosylformylglycinamidine synthase subunit PurS [Chloroflexota bacterium]
MPYLARVRVSLKPAVNDPQGVTIARALKSLGFEGVRSVRAGKYLEVRVDDDDRDTAEAKVREMCQKLLANPVTETFSFELEKL